MTTADIIRDKLSAALAPDDLRITDESHLHAGHSGARPEGETHFRVEIVAQAFTGQPRVARQRRVYELLAAELAGGIHALALFTRTPEEAEAAAERAAARDAGNP